MGGILVIGVFEQYLIYLAVRFSVFNHAEFDERVDGVIYGVAAGLGVATVLNFLYVVDHGGVDLDIGAMRMVINTLAFASFGGVLGYFIGQSRFEQTPVHYLPLGLGIAAALNGVLFFLLEGGATGLNHGKPWQELILAAIVSLGSLAIVFWLVQRANEETLRLARSALAAAASPPVGDDEPVTPKRDVDLQHHATQPQVNTPADEGTAPLPAVDAAASDTEPGAEQGGAG